jgi:uncharacterized protein (TIGR02453 family)
MEFTGFPPEALDFYEGLEVHNDRAYWTEHRDTYQRCVKEPMEALLAGLEPEFGAGRLFRPYRDTRFSADKSPYKTHQGAVVSRGEGTVGGWFVQVSADGLFAGGGFGFSHTPEQVHRLRRAVDDDVVGMTLQRLVDTLRNGGYEIGGDTLKTRPRGYPADHPRIELLRHRTLWAVKRWAPGPDLHSSAASELVRQVWRSVRPLLDWLDEHVGPA